MRAAGRGEHLAKISHGHGGPARRDQQADEFDDFTGPGQQFAAANAGDIGIQIEDLAAWS